MERAKYGMQKHDPHWRPLDPRDRGDRPPNMVLGRGADVPWRHIKWRTLALPTTRSVCLCVSGAKPRSRLCHNGNERAAVLTLNLPRRDLAVDQLILRHLRSAESGREPLGSCGWSRMLSRVGIMVRPEIAFCFANGQPPPRQRQLDTGIDRGWQSADFDLMDRGTARARQKYCSNPLQRATCRGWAWTVIDGVVHSPCAGRNTPARDPPAELIGQRRHVKRARYQARTRTLRPSDAMFHRHSHVHLGPFFGSPKEGFSYLYIHAVQFRQDVGRVSRLSLRAA